MVSATLVVALFLGRRIDRWLETGNFFTVLFLFLAVVGLGVNFYQMVSNLNRQDDESESETNEE